MSIRLILLISLTIASSDILAETIYLNGKPCFVVGNQVNCPGMESGQDEAARAARAETKRLQEKSRRLDECLRKSDWPGMPSRSECQSMYGE